MSDILDLIDGLDVPQVVRDDAKAVYARIAQAEAEEAALIAQQEAEKAAEIAAMPGIPVDMKLSTIQSDLKLKFLNKEKNAMIAGAPFRVEVVRPSGKTETWEDDDRDGIIYRDGQIGRAHV